jgi:ABC-type nitrate/sulfonate/bicarbonate transport system ATPase subunit
VLEGVKKKEARKIAAPMFSGFGLEGTQELYPAQLSGGMRQRAAFLRTYLSAVKEGYVPGRQKKGTGGGELHGAALLDEPFSALDTITKGQIHTWFLDMMQKIDLSAIFITHDIDEALLLSDRIYVLTGSPGRITNEIPILPGRTQRKEFNLTQEFLDYKRRILKLLAGS